MEIKAAAGLLEKLLREQEIRKYSYTLRESEKQELNLENGEFKLMRTVFSGIEAVRVFRGAKTGSVSGNDLSEEGLERMVADAVLAAESAPEDPCHEIAPDQGSLVFRQGTEQPDLDLFIGRIREFLDTTAKEYPKVRIMSAIGSYDRWTGLSRNSNGSSFETFGGQYSFSVEISAAEGDKTTGLDYTGICTQSLDRPFMEMSDFRQHLENIQKSIDPEPMHGKFEGTVIFTPDAAEDFIRMTLSNYTSDSVVIDGTSLWLDRVGEQVADEKLTISLRPYDERIVTGERRTASGFRSEDADIIRNGVLKAHRISLYAANKTGRPVMKNTGWDLVVEPGDSTLAEMIASVGHGLLLGGFSGGQPGTNGEFSGVAKNSFLIENGKIGRAVTETMVNGNLGEIFRRIRAISREQRCDGNTVVPYIAADGITISGK